MTTKQAKIDLAKATEDLHKEVTANTKLDAEYGALRDQLQQIAAQLYDHTPPAHITNPKDDFLRK